MLYVVWSTYVACVVLDVVWSTYVFVLCGHGKSGESYPATKDIFNPPNLALKARLLVSTWFLTFLTNLAKFLQCYF